MLQTIRNKIKTLPESVEIATTWKETGKKIVWTNGCFDLLHYGHIVYLAKARELGDRLIVGLNSDLSVKRLKGANRPILDETTRAIKLASFAFIDLVVVFEEDTPLKCIEMISPSYLVKGGDYQIHEIIGSTFVQKNGGKVVTIPFEKGHSSSDIIRKIQNGTHED